jgi:hypothetical protein
MRTYKRKTPRRGNRDKRMATVVRLHAHGISNREIGRRLSIDHKTVASDLARWERERPNVVLLPGNSAGELRPVRGQIPQPDSPSDSKIIPLRRSS